MATESCNYSLQHFTTTNEVQINRKHDEVTTPYWDSSSHVYFHLMAENIKILWILNKLKMGKFIQCHTSATDGSETLNTQKLRTVATRKCKECQFVVNKRKIRYLTYSKKYCLYREKYTVATLTQLLCRRHLC